MQNINTYFPLKRHSSILKMNGRVPDWNVEEDYGPFMNDLPSASQKVSMRADQGLIELVWQNGHVIMQNQDNRRNTLDMKESKQPSKLEVPSKCGGSSTNPSDFFDEEETAAWFQHPLDDTLDKEFCSQIFQGMPIRESKLEREAPLSSDLYKKSGIVEDAELLQVLTPKQSNKFQSDQNTMPPPKSQHVISIPSKGDTASGIVNFSHFSRPMKLYSGYSGCREVERNLETNHNHKQQGESSLLSSKLSGYCGSNQIQDQPELMHTFTNVKSDPIVKPIERDHKKANERGHIETHDRATITSPSAGSGTSAGRTCTNAANHKRKGRDEDGWECQSEETDYQSTEVGKPQRSTARRSRAAEVHNLSERRRRDRINEKMKALQELIPHCNKTDKASMLDEAIEYLKSLQLQVQMMWMGNGMAPMMFPSAQHYLSFMGTMPRIPGAVQMPPLLFGNQTISPTTTTSKATAGQSTYSSNANQSQHSSIPEAFLHYLGAQNMQSPEGMKMFAPYASQLIQPNCALLSMSSCSPVTGIDPPKDDRNG